MRRPSPALIGSVALHLGVAALAFVSWPRREDLPPAPSSVPVSILSSEVVEAAAVDNPSDELITEDGASAPAETVEAPPEPQPTPSPSTPSPPTPAPSLRPTPPRPTPPAARPNPPRPTTPRPTPPRNTPPRATPRTNQPALDLSALAGPPRPTPNRGRPSTGQQGRGAAPQASGPQLSALARQVTPNWNVRVVCDLPGGDAIVIRVRVRLDASGRIQGTPVVENARSDATGRAASEGILQALRATSPFDIPAGFAPQEVPFRFETARQCANR